MVNDVENISFAAPSSRQNHCWMAYLSLGPFTQYSSKHIFHTHTHILKMKINKDGAQPFSQVTLYSLWKIRKIIVRKEQIKEVLGS